MKLSDLLFENEKMLLAILHRLQHIIGSVGEYNVRGGSQAYQFKRSINTDDLLKILDQITAAIGPKMVISPILTSMKGCWMVGPYTIGVWFDPNSSNPKNGQISVFVTSTTSLPDLTKSNLY